MVMRGFAIREAEDAEIVFVAGAVSTSYSDLQHDKHRHATPRGKTYSRCDIRRADIADILHSPFSTTGCSLLADDTHCRVPRRLYATVGEKARQRPEENQKSQGESIALDQRKQ
jgi:hypothetical protein